MRAGVEHLGWILAPTAAYSSWQNGKAERAIGMLNKRLANRAPGATNSGTTRTGAPRNVARLPKDIKPEDVWSWTAFTLALMGITIRPLDDRADQARQRLAELRDDDEGIHQGTARVLYAIYTGNISTRETRNDHQVQLGALKNRGAITFGTGTGNRFTLSEDVTYAFEVS